MRWGMEPSTRPAKRSKSKRLSSDYGERLCQRLWDAYGLIASRKNPRRKSNRKPARKCGRNVACLRAGPFGAVGRIRSEVTTHPVRGRNARDGTGRSRRAQDARKRVNPIGCMRNIKAAHSALQGHCGRFGIFCGYSRTAQAYPRRARTGADGARGRRAYIRTGARLCGALGGSWGDLGRPAAIRA